MLSDLLGSKSAERILLFLLVNECGFAAEVQRALDIPLTPLQSILHKFEKSGVLSFTFQGKRKLYRFNLSYPLLDELKALLKKGFVLLPPERKKALFSRKESWELSQKDDFAKQKRKALCLASFWTRLNKVRTVAIEAPLKGHAFGEVFVNEEKKDTLLFTEKGHWIHPMPQEIEFTNALRWSFDYKSSTVGLEHLRYGMNRPVFLFHLTPTGSRMLQSIESHLCHEDCYFGRIEFTDKHIRFLWRIIGPRKNETLIYTYS